MQTTAPPLCGCEPFRHERPTCSRLCDHGALSLTMALHELCTNAAKYGALSSATGRVAINWRVTTQAAFGQTRLHLQWEEQGGPPVSAPQKRGFGSRLIERGLARELDAEVRLDYAPTGVVCAIDAPLR
jgi:two-component sensor histidine kinase